MAIAPAKFATGGQARGGHEFRLIVECCRWSFTGGDFPTAHTVDPAFDWPLFLRVVRFHRVQGLVWKCLSTVGADLAPDVTSALSPETYAIVAANLRIAAEARLLRNDFEGAGVAMLFIKGMTLAKLAYSDPLLKMGWDIDLLVDPQQLEDAAGLLEARGYRRILPGPSVGLREWHQRHKESVWKRDQLYVELHTRLADNQDLIPQINVHSARREVAVAPGINLPTLAQDELFAYLCVHGASSLWFRLKWITDLAALLSGLDPPAVERLHARAQDLGAGRASGSALLLADSLFGSLAGSALRSELASDRGNRWLLKAATWQLTGRVEPVEPTSIVGGTAAIHLSQLLLLAGFRFKLFELLRQLRSAVD